MAMPIRENRVKQRAEDWPMLRSAEISDLTRLAAIRDRAGEDALSDPALANDDALRRWIAARAAAVWDDDGVAGFAAADGGHIHLLVDSAQRSRGIGRALLSWVCAAVKEAGHAEATVTLAPGAMAERHYRADRWAVIGRGKKGELVFQKPL